MDVNHRVLSWGYGAPPRLNPLAEGWEAIRVMTEGLGGVVCQPSDVTCHPDVFACGSCLVNV